MQETRKSGFSTAGLVLGIIGVCTSFIPIINNLSFVMGILAVIFGIIAFIKKTGTGKALTVIILGIIAIAITINSQKELSDAIDTMTGNKTEDILTNCVDVTLGSFEVKKGSYITETELKVNVKNKTSETKSFNIQVEAVDNNGTRLALDNIYANSLGAGQNQEFKIFQYVESEKLDSMKKATFKIVEASMY